MPSQKPNRTHHARIHDEMRQNILDGTWAPGHQLPKETELAEEYGVSRMTMNKVLTQLSNEGFLVRRRRSGTFVAQPRAQSAVMEINDISQEVAALGLSHEWRLLRAEKRALTAAERHLLDLEEAAPGSGGRGAVLFLHGLHLARSEPFCLETRVIDLAVVPGATEVDFSARVPGQWLLETMPWSAASHRVRAVNATAGDARDLGLPTGTACLEILRKTRIDQAWVTHVRLLYPGEAHQLVAEFAPSIMAAPLP